MTDESIKDSLTVPTLQRLFQNCISNVYSFEM